MAQGEGGGRTMIARITALFEALTASDLEAARPTDLERFAALCRHWASLAELRGEITKPGILSALKDGDRSA
jgi:hypothetical protein